MPASAKGRRRRRTRLPQRTCCRPTSPAAPPWKSASVATMSDDVFEDPFATGDDPAAAEREQRRREREERRRKRESKGSSKEAAAAASPGPEPPVVTRPPRASTSAAVAESSPPPPPPADSPKSGKADKGATPSHSGRRRLGVALALGAVFLGL